MGIVLERRRKETAGRVQQLRDRLADASQTCETRACVYVTGSYGRGETSTYSDLDLFIASPDSRDRPKLSNLEAILVKADLIHATKDLSIREFSGDGEYLKHYTVKELIQTMGTPQDDVANTFTARLLLLLESDSLLGQAAYDQVICEVISAYWIDYEEHRDDFMPAFLANDILRMWRTFCVNYEAFTRREPEKDMAKRRLKNYKLKHSRLLTCYSALLYLLAIYSRNETVTPVDARKMVKLTPTLRIEWLLRQSDLADAHDAIQFLLEAYEKFLLNTEADEEELVRRFMDKEERKIFLAPAHRFGDSVFKVMEILGQGRPFHRLLVV